MKTAAESKPFLSSVLPDSIQNWLHLHKEPAYRGSQILSWLYRKWICSPDKMKNLPIELRNKLKQDFICNSSELADSVTDSDQVTKLLIRLHDNECIESVIIPAGRRRTFCLSTQVGCPIKCRFCASGQSGLVRNMDAGEIIEQFFHACHFLKKLPDNIVFMGIGEGLLNFNNLVLSLQLLSGSDTIGFGHRRITVSTSGWVPGIKKLADLQQQWNLAVSLHAPDDKTRALLIPEKFSFPIKEIMAAVDYYREKTNRMVTFEYTLLAGINDSPDQALALAKFAKNTRAKVNIIPFNPGKNQSPFQRPKSDKIQHFMALLKEKNVQVTCRNEKGTSISAACGQLRSESKI